MEEQTENRFEYRTTFRDIQKALVGGMMGLLVGTIFGMTMMSGAISPERANIKRFPGSKAELLYIETPDKKSLTLWRDSTNEYFQRINSLEYYDKIEALRNPTNNSTLPNNVGTYNGHRVEISNESGRRGIKMYYSNFTPQERFGSVYARTSESNGLFDVIEEKNLDRKDSLRELANTEELEKAYKHILNTGYIPTKIIL